jgi:hypothetical protein
VQELNGIKDNAKMNDFKMKNKIYEMIIYASPCLDQFPRSEKYALAQDIRKTMYKILRLVVMLENKHYKKTTLGDLDTEVDVLRHLIRLAADNRLHPKQAPCLPMKKYENLSKHLAEIGKMIGGYEKYINTKSK